MTNQQHPIIPPPELVDQWHVEAVKGFRTNGVYAQDIATQAARWGADQELAACAQWVEANFGQLPTHNLHQFRRPKPSLKEQALALLDKAEDPSWDINDFSILRQALEALPND